MLRATTFFSRNSDALLKSVTSAVKSSHSSNVAFTVSANHPTDNLSSLVTYLSRVGRNTAGCIAASVPSRVSQYYCSVLEMSSSVSSPFSSNIPGRPMVQVGRNHHIHAARHKKAEEARKKEMDQILEGRRGWGGLESASYLGPGLQLPRGLTQSQDNKTIFFFSDLQPEGLISSLDHHFPNSHKFGVMASSTPFVTGRPVTLFQNLKVVSEGAVGFSIVNNSYVVAQGCDGLEAIGSPFLVTNSQSNLIHSLDDKNPTALLLEGLASLNLKGADHGFDHRGTDYLVAILSSGNSVVRVSKITAGDPKRGSLSLDAEMAPPQGTRVQFFRRRSAEELDHTFGLPFENMTTYSVTNPSAALFPAAELVYFAAEEDRLPLTTTSDDAKSDVTMVSGRFFLGSENGFLSNLDPLNLSTPQLIWKHSVAGTWATIGLVP